MPIKKKGRLSPPPVKLIRACGRWGSATMPRRDGTPSRAPYLRRLISAGLIPQTEGFMGLRSACARSPNSFDPPISVSLSEPFRAQRGKSSSDAIFLEPGRSGDVRSGNALLECLDQFHDLWSLIWDLRLDGFRKICHVRRVGLSFAPICWRCSTAKSSCAASASGFQDQKWHRQRSFTRSLAFLLGD